MKFIKETNKGLRHLVSGPFIWMVLIPVIFLDIVMEVYHRICFPLYGLTLIDRKRYIRIDRHKLAYLSYPQKFYCMYCGYVNGFLAYAVQIAGETEKYWCGVMHEQRDGFVNPDHHNDFPAYGDEEGYEKKYLSK